MGCGVMGGTITPATLSILDGVAASRRGSLLDSSIRRIDGRSPRTGWPCVGAASFRLINTTSDVGRQSLARQLLDL